MAVKVKLTMTFDGACVHYYTSEGADIWLPADVNHSPVLHVLDGVSSSGQTGDIEISLAGWTVHIVHGRFQTPIPIGKTKSAKRLAKLRKILEDRPLADGLPNVTLGQLPACLNSLVRLSKGEMLEKPITGDPPYGDAEWTFDLSDSQSHKQKLTSVCEYSLPDLDGPVRLVLRRGTTEQWVQSRDGATNWAVEIEMRDAIGAEPIQEIGNEAFLNEFLVVQRCYGPGNGVVPRTGKLVSTTGRPIGSMDPLCPQGEECGTGG